MRSAPVPDNEENRLAALYQYGILDTEVESSYECVMRLLCSIFSAPIATVTFVDRDRQWFKSFCGLNDCQTPRDISFCGHVVDSGKPLVVEDASQDERFHDNPLVVNEPHIRFYAGVPLTTPDGYHIGVLTVQDTRPRSCDDESFACLQDLAFLVVDELELRLKTRQHERELKRFIGGPTVIFVWEETSRGWLISYVSPNVKQVLGYYPEQLLGVRFTDLVHPEDRQQLLRENEEACIISRSSHYEYSPYRLKNAAGEYRWVRESSVAESNALGKEIIYLGYLNDISHQVELEEQKSADRSQLIAYQSQLEQLLHTDPLTELPNRLLLHDRLEQALVRRKRDRAALAVLVLDLRDFRAINDSLGKAFGDKVLSRLGNRLQQILRGGDTVARLGGDEFGILLPWLHSVDDTVELVERITRWSEESLCIDGHEICVVSRIGASVYSGSGATTATNLLEQADTAMHEAKKEDVCYRFFSAELTERARERVQLAADLRRALGGNQLMVYYQPQVDLTSGAWVGVEALLRWPHPQHGWISPARFIPVAERSGFISRLGEWVLDSACIQARQWLDNGFQFGRVGVNVAATQLLTDDWVERVKEVLNRSGLPARYLELEITESLLVDSKASVIDGLEELRRLGVAIAVDDFGTGYSALRYLKDLPVDRVKIDRSFIQGFPDEHQTTAIIRAILALGDGLGLSVIAEGIETENQHRALLKIGCCQGQGFYFVRPADHVYLENTYL